MASAKSLDFSDIFYIKRREFTRILEKYPTDHVIFKFLSLTKGKISLHEGLNNPI